MWKQLHAALRKLFQGGVSVSKTQETGKELGPVWLIVGLGNPGREHAGNRHNIGFMALDRMVADASFPDWREKFAAQVSEGDSGRGRIMFMKPQTYMNRSGQAVASAARFYKVPASHIIVVHDELDLPLGKIRVKTGGGAAGHNGLKSIDADMGDNGYMRVRMGIGHPGDRDRVSGYVLSDFTDEERHKADIALAAVSRHIGLLINGQEADFMSKIANETRGA